MGISQYRCDRGDYFGAFGTAGGSENSLGYLRALSTAQSVGLLEGEDLAALTPAELLNRVTAIETNDLILGGTLYGPTGGTPRQFWRTPELTLQESLQGWRPDRYRRWQDRYDAPWDTALLEGEYVLIVRHDAAWVRTEFFAFIGRIAGLVVIISVFVTGATLFVSAPHFD